jgi:hypothetical protein
MLSLFELTNCNNIVYKWFDVLKKGHYIIGYAIMPSYVHVIIAFHSIAKELTVS